VDNPFWSVREIHEVCRKTEVCDESLSMNQADFDGMESALLLMTVAYNFLSLFKQIIMGGEVGN
jgi:hypothetical protein